MILGFMEIRRALTVCKDELLELLDNLNIDYDVSKLTEENTEYLVQISEEIDNNISSFLNEKNIYKGLINLLGVLGNAEKYLSLTIDNLILEIIKRKEDLKEKYNNLLK